MKITDKKFSAGSMTSLIAAGLSLIATIAFLIYGTVYPVYFDAAVVIFLLLGVAGFAAYALWDSDIANILPLIAVLCGSIDMGVFFLNSYPVWADWWGNINMYGSADGSFNMYGSQGGVTPVIIILVITVLSILCGIVTCFMRKNKEAK